MRLRHYPSKYSIFPSGRLARSMWHALTVHPCTELSILIYNVSVGHAVYWDYGMGARPCTPCGVVMHKYEYEKQLNHKPSVGFYE